MNSNSTPSYSTINYVTLKIRRVCIEKNKSLSVDLNESLDMMNVKCYQKEHRKNNLETNGN